MAARHRARFRSIQILRVAEIEDNRHPSTKHQAAPPAKTQVPPAAQSRQEPKHLLCIGRIADGCLLRPAPCRALRLCPSSHRRAFSPDFELEKRVVSTSLGPRLQVTCTVRDASQNKK